MPRIAYSGLRIAYSSLFIVRGSLFIGYWLLNIYDLDPSTSSGLALGPGGPSTEKQVSQHSPAASQVSSSRG